MIKNVRNSGTPILEELQLCYGKAIISIKTFNSEQVEREHFPLKKHTLVKNFYKETPNKINGHQPTVVSENYTNVAISIEVHLSIIDYLIELLIHTRNA